MNLARVSVFFIVRGFESMYTPIYTHTARTYRYIYIYIYVCVYLCVCVWVILCTARGVQNSHWPDYIIETRILSSVMNESHFLFI